jgi:hypothetical protein
VASAVAGEILCEDGTTQEGDVQDNQACAHLGIIGEVKLWAINEASAIPAAELP